MGLLLVRSPRPPVKLPKSQTLFRKGKGGKEHEKVCSLFGVRTLCKAEPGSVVEMYCPTCKKTVCAEVRYNTVVTTQQDPPPLKRAT